MARVQVNDLRQAALNPQARPVDAFVAPLVQQPSKDWRDLAQALSSVQPKLEAYGTKVMKEEIEQAQLEAQRDRLKNQMAYAEAVKAGVVPAGANPWYVRAYKELDGELAGQQEYFNSVTQAWEQSGLATQEFETEFEREAALADFLQQQREAFLEGKDDIHWIKGFERGRAQAEASVTQRHIQATVQANEEKFQLSTEKKLMDILMNSESDEAAAMAIAEYGREINGKFGQSFTRYNTTTIKAISQAAQQHALARNYEAAYATLDLLNKIPTTEGNYLGGTGPGKEAYNDGIARFQQMERADIQWQRSNISWKWQEQDRKWTLMTRGRQWDELAAQDAFIGIVRQINENPVSDIVGFLNEAVAKNPKLADKVPALMNMWEQRVRADRIVPEDTLHIAGLRTGIERGAVSPDDLLTELSEGRLSYDTFINFMDDIARTNNVRGKINALPRDHRDLIDMYEKNAVGLAQGELSAFGQPTVAGRDSGFQVQRVMRAAISEYLANNPSPAYGELMNFLEEQLVLLKKSGLIGDSVGKMTAASATFGQAQVPPLSDLRQRMQPQQAPTPAQQQQQPQQAPQQRYPTPPQAAIDRLKANPELAPQFEQMFGPGSAAQYLNQ